MISGSKTFKQRAGAVLLVGTMLGGSATPALAQDAPAIRSAGYDPDDGTGRGGTGAGNGGSTRCAASAHDSLDRGARQPASRAGDHSRLCEPAPRRDLLRRHARPGASRPLRDAAVRRRDDHRHRNRQSRHQRPRESGHQPHHLRGQQAPQGGQDHAGNQAFAAPDLHPFGGPVGRRPDPRSLPPPRPLRRPGRAEDRPARPEPRRRRVRSYRRRPRQGPGDQHHRQQDVSATAACARKCTLARPVVRSAS